MLSGAHRAKCCMRKNVYKYINIHMPFLKASIKWNSTILKNLETLSKFQFQIHRFAVFKRPKTTRNWHIIHGVFRRFQHSTCKFRAGRVGTWSLVILCHVWKWPIWIGGFECTHSIHWATGIRCIPTSTFTLYKSQHLQWTYSFDFLVPLIPWKIPLPRTSQWILLVSNQISSPWLTFSKPCTTWRVAKWRLNEVKLLMVQKWCVYQLRLVVYPLIYRILYI